VRPVRDETLLACLSRQKAVEYAGAGEWRNVEKAWKKAISHFEKVNKLLDETETCDQGIGPCPLKLCSIHRLIAEDILRWPSLLTIIFSLNLIPTMEQRARHSGSWFPFMTQDELPFAFRQLARPND
jgi:hypothetical protein